jgi:hypothetical protein
MHTIITRLLVTLTLAALIACGSPPPASSVTSVSIDGGDRTIVVGDSLTLTATVEITGGASTSATWSSGNESVATVAGYGLVTSLAAGTTTITATSVTDPTKNDAVTLTIDPLGDLRWTRQFGTGSAERAYGIATDPSGNVYTTGYTLGAFEGSNAGSFDAFISSYDSDGALRWTRQFDADGAVFAYGIATDPSGNVYTTGYTIGAFEGSGSGGADAFIRSYDSDGNVRWTRQFGSDGVETDIAYGIATDADGNVYTTGVTDGDLGGSNAGGLDAFIRSYDSDGNVRWTRQFGTSGNDAARGIATDPSGNVYITGDTDGVLDGFFVGFVDAFIRSYDSDGNLRWTRQFGSGGDGADHAYGIATDPSGNVYIAGETSGTFEGTNAGSWDAFIRSYDADGVLRWTRQFGSFGLDHAYGVATDPSGNVYTTGNTSGALQGSTAGGLDAFISSYDSDGAPRWTRQFGTSGNDTTRGIAADPSGNVYATGTTDGVLEGSNAGDDDVFIRSYGR